MVKLQIVYQLIENTLLKHITGVVLCFSKNTSDDQNLLHKDLLSYKKLTYFAEQAKDLIFVNDLVSLFLLHILDNKSFIDILYRLYRYIFNTALALKNLKIKLKNHQWISCYGLKI